MAPLPAGTVTFLFTDIEGSTRLLQHLGDRYADVLAEYRRLLRTVAQEWGGQEVDTQGDAFFVAFPRAKDALVAAVTAQRSILSHRWPNNVSVQVRMGLHTGEPLAAETGYIGMDVHRAARICGTGHGGQILISDTTRPLVEEDLSPDVRFRDLGQYRLKDLARPQRLFQVVAGGLPTDFPPLKSLDVLPNNLPIQLTSFVGRERDIAEVKGLFSTTRLLTLTGAGGAGKTRLALRVAAEVLEEFPNGVWLVELAALSDPTLIPQIAASALTVREQPGRPLIATLTDYLQPMQLLLLLDNCEHLLSACAHLAEVLLRACPHLRILATSREGLGIGGELTYRVPSLSVPDVRRPAPLDHLVQHEAVRLFIERVTFAVPTFRVTEQNAPAIAQVCDRLDGIPLAIELAAAQVKALSVERIAVRLDNRFRLLTGGSRTALPRHQTLQGTMDWSHDLLSQKERTLLRRLSVFAGGFTLEAAEVVGSRDGLDEVEILTLLTHLVDKSLVVKEEQGGDDRYRLLETVRQYAWNKLLEAGEVAELRRQHASFFLALAEAGEPHLTDADQETWLKRLDAEHDNFRAALEWSKTVAGGEETRLRLAGALWRFWNARGYWSEGLRWLEGAVAAGSGVSPSARAKAFFGAGVLAWLLSDNDRAAALIDESLALNRQLADKRGIADSLRILAQVAWGREDYDRARALGEESLSLFQEVGNKWGIAAVFRFLGYLAQSRHDLERARPSLEQSLALARELGDKRGIAQSLYGLGQIARDNGDYERATKLYEESLVVSREMGDKYFISNSLHTLGILANYRSDPARAVAFLEESLAIRKEIGDKGSVSQALRSLASVALSQKDYGRAAELYKESLSLQKRVPHKGSVAECFEGLAQAADGQKESERAARLLGAAERLREGLPSPAPRELRKMEQSVTKVRGALGEEVFRMKWAEGRAMTLEQAIEYALTAEDPGKPS
jgi:predicted ATPase/class 3 adenylate cyclase